MAAPSCRMLVSVWNSGGALLGASRRRGLIASRAESAKMFHTKPPPGAKAEEKFSYTSGVYMAGGKAQNPMKKVALAWVIGFPCGILFFLLAKMKVNERRVEQMKERRRIRQGNMGEYHSEPGHKSG